MCSTDYKEDQIIKRSMGLLTAQLYNAARLPAPLNTQGSKTPLRQAHEDNRSQPALETAAAFSLLETLKLPLIFF